jgi:hypothetical protein
MKENSFGNTHLLLEKAQHIAPHKCTRLALKAFLKICTTLQPSLSSFFYPPKNHSVFAIFQIISGIPKAEALGMPILRVFLAFSTAFAS